MTAVRAPRTRSFLARCPKCRETRLVSGVPSGEHYPEDADGVRWRACPSCVPQGRTGPAQLHDRDWLVKAYENQSANQIGKQLGCSCLTVCRALRRHDIPMRTRTQAMQMAAVTRSERGAYGANRQMVTGDGFSDSATGAVRHLA